MTDVRLDEEDIRRYSRHLIMPEVGMEGQRRLKAASVLVVGAGGLGSPLALYLAAAGVGRIGLVDFDVVEFSNLQRQILYGTRDVGHPKLAAARARLVDVNPRLDVVTHETAVTPENALDILGDYDVIADGTDNFPTRYLINDACVLLGKPNVYGSIFRFEGQASVFWASRGPCYRCLYPDPPPPGLVPSCAEGGVLGVLPGIVGAVQATEVIKIIIGQGSPLTGTLLLFDALEMRFRELRVRKDPDCPVCGDNPTVTRLIDYEAFCGTHRDGRVTDAGFEITPAELKQRLDRGDALVLLDVRTVEERRICRLEGAVFIPLDELPARMSELDTADEIVAYCRVGARSAYAAQLLRQAGFGRTYNLAGGLHAWSEDVDPRVPRY